MHIRERLPAKNRTSKINKYCACYEKWKGMKRPIHWTNDPRTNPSVRNPCVRGADFERFRGMWKTEGCGAPAFCQDAFQDAFHARLPKKNCNCQMCKGSNSATRPFLPWLFWPLLSFFPVLFLPFRIIFLLFLLRSFPFPFFLAFPFLFSSVFLLFSSIHLFFFFCLVVIVSYRVIYVLFSCLFLFFSWLSFLSMSFPFIFLTVLFFSMALYTYHALNTCCTRLYLVSTATWQHQIRSATNQIEAPGS